MTFSDAGFLGILRIKPTAVKSNFLLALVAKLDAHLTGDQEVAG